MSAEEGESVVTSPPPAENWGDPNAPSIMEAMDKFFEQEASAPPEPPPLPPEIIPETPETAQEASEPELPDIAPDFFPDATEGDVKPAEVKPADGFDEEAFDKATADEVKGMEPKAGEKWKALKAELKAAKQQSITPEIQTKLSELEVKASEVDGLREKVKELSGKSAKLQMSEDPEYQDRVINAIAKTFVAADELSAKIEVDPTIIRAIIEERSVAKQEQMIMEHFGDKTSLSLTKVVNLVERYNESVQLHEEMMADAEKRLEKNQTARLEADRKFLADQRLAVQLKQKELWNEHKELIPGFLDEDGRETEIYRKLMARSMAIDFSQARAQDQARAALSGTVLPYALKQIRELQNRLSAYEQDGAKKVRTAPAAGSSVKAPPASGAKPKTFMEAMASDYQFTG